MLYVKITRHFPYSPLHLPQEQFTKKIESLERLLKEERDRAKAAEKQVEQRVEEQTAITDDAKIWHREKDILQQEVWRHSVSASAFNHALLCASCELVLF